MVDMSCVVDARAELGEGTVWDPVAGVLWWIDIWGRNEQNLKTETFASDPSWSPLRG